MAEFKLKDYTEYGINDTDMTVEDSPVRDFEFTDSLEYDAHYEVDALGTSTGGVFRTNRSPNRVEISNIDNALYVYISGVKRVRLDSNSLSIYNASGIITSRLDALSLNVFNSAGTLTGRVYSVSLLANEVTLDNVHGAVSLIGTGTGAGANALQPGSDGIIDLGGASFRWLNVSAVRYYSQTAYWEAGSGDPEGVVTAPVGSLWTRTDGGASTTLYVKESGAGSTGWVAK